MNKSAAALLVLVVLAIGLAAGYWIAGVDRPPEAETVTVTESEAPEIPPARTGPQHPVAAIEPPSNAERKLVPLPPLDDSDSYFLLALVDIFGPDVRDALVSEALIDKFVTTVDNLPRGHVAEKIRPVSRLSSNFVATASGDDGEYTLSADNFSRYDTLVGLLDNADIDLVVTTYRRFYPLLQQSYQRLGYPDGYFNDRVIEVIDELLLTPEPAGAIRLVRPHVLYEFADPELEALSSGQKLLLRMGPLHRATIRTRLTELRAAIASPPVRPPQQ